MLIVKIPSICLNEQHYILDIILGDFLGLVYEVEYHNGYVIEITAPSCTDGSIDVLTLDASFFCKAEKYWLKPESMPVMPLTNWNPANDGIVANLVQQTVPVLYGKPSMVKNEEHVHLNVDIFGSIFFMLSRYEELVTSDRDAHERFPAWASVAYKAHFLDRPIVNEYVEIFWECLRWINPNLVRIKRQFRKLISCDVDNPFDSAADSFMRTIVRIGARLIRDKSPKFALYDGLNYLFKKGGSDYFDAYRYNIDWMMEVNEAAGNIVAFYFIPIQTHSKWEDAYDIRSQKIASLLRHIVDSGHEIGFHPGYQTYKSPDTFRQSTEVFREACASQTIDLPNIGGRQHYLRYDIACTPRLWEENGFTYDSSLAYADRAGFRCGVCYEYTMFDLIGRRKMNLKQRPLVTMEGTIIGHAYENRGYSQEAAKRFEYLMSVCRQFEGDYTLLWHNSFFISSFAKKTYLKLINT